MRVSDTPVTASGVTFLGVEEETGLNENRPVGG